MVGAGFKPACFEPYEQPAPRNSLREMTVIVSP